MRIKIQEDKIAQFCEKHRIKKLSFFGSVLREDFTPESDVDVLVEFEPGEKVGLISLSGMELELETILGRKVDLNTRGLLSPHYRETVLSSAETAYEQA